MGWFNKSTEHGNISLHGWANDKLKSMSLQRNVLLLMCFITLGSLGAGMFAVMKISQSRTVEPFVIEIAKKTGVVTLVDPVTVKQYSANRAVNEYFLVRYLKARETFSPQTYTYFYYTEVRLFSSKDVYSSFRNWIRLSNQESPLVLYSNILESEMKIRSIQHIGTNSVQIRFSVQFKMKERVVRKDKIAIISYEYASLEMNEDERQVNPLGFLVTSYKVDDEFL